MKDLSKIIRSGLSDFWDSQLRFEIEGDDCHIAYPLLMPDGWQLSFSLYRKASPSQSFCLSDNGKIMSFLEDYGANSHTVRLLIKEKCGQFGIVKDGTELIRASAKPPTPLEVELYAEGPQAIAYLSYKSEPIHDRPCVAKRNFMMLIKTHQYKERMNRMILGETIGEIEVDTVLDMGCPLACKVAEKTGKTREYMEMWAYRLWDAKKVDDRLSAIMIYNPDIGKWDDRSLNIGFKNWDLFAPYYETDKIVAFINSRAA